MIGQGKTGGERKKKKVVAAEPPSIKMLLPRYESSEKREKKKPVSVRRIFGVRAATSSSMSLGEKEKKKKKRRGEGGPYQGTRQHVVDRHVETSQSRKGRGGKKGPVDESCPGRALPLTSR